MKIITQITTTCRVCRRLTGKAIEQINGVIPVQCDCDLAAYRKAERQLPNPGLVSVDDGSLVWRPISDYRSDAGKVIHVPHFALLERRK